MTETNNIRRVVMRRVHFVHAARAFISNAAGALVVLGFSLYLLGREVFVAQVFRNMEAMTDVAMIARFFESAFLNTTFLVQTLTVVTAVAGLWLARECARLIRNTGVQFA